MSQKALKKADILRVQLTMIRQSGRMRGEYGS